MAEVWRLIEVEDSLLRDAPLGDGVKLHYLALPRLSATLEERSVDEVIDAASRAGFEARYASFVDRGVPPWIWRRIEAAVLAEVRKKVGKDFRAEAICIEAAARMAKRLHHEPA
jgi:hypothetical protein